MHVQSEYQVDLRSRLTIVSALLLKAVIGARVQRMASHNIYGDDKMTDRWLKGVNAAVALMVVGTVAVQAADLPTRKRGRLGASVRYRRRSLGPGSTSV